MKIGTIALLVVGVIVVNPELQMPAVTQFVARRRADHPGHALPLRVHHHRLRRHLGLPRADRLRHHAQDDRQGDATSAPIGYGAMLIEGLVGVIALIAATSLHPGDYFAINVAADEVRRSSACPTDESAPTCAQAGRRERGGPHRRRGVAGRRHGADLLRRCRA